MNLVKKNNWKSASPLTILYRCLYLFFVCMCVCIQDEKRAALKEEMEITLAKTRKQSLGNIRFIGELFKLQMLSETIMHECITRLLKSTSDEESLECFARLITTVGKELDSKEAAKVEYYIGF